VPLRRGGNDIAALWPYNWKWFVESGRGAHYAALNALRNIVQDLSHEDISFLFRKDILNGEMLTASINGTFMVPDLKTMALTLGAGVSPGRGLLLQLNKATTVGTKILKHYLKYPESWNPAAFDAWRARTDGLLRKIGIDLLDSSLIMSKERITRRQKDVSRLLREKKKIQKDTVKKGKKK